MSPSRTYLDYNATAPLRRSAREAMLAAMAEPGNPSSVHAEGRRARDIVETAREQVANLVNARPAEVVFTSGAAEANATVMAGPWTDILVSGIEHESVLAVRHRPDIALHEVPAASSGVAAVEIMAERVLKGPRLRRALLSLQLANNETGVMQPVAAVAAFARAHDVSMHCDAVQGLGRVPVDFAALGLDFMSLSGHKIGGPKGIGALVIRDGVVSNALIPGGQERRRRGGTENVAAIAGFGAAAGELREGFGEMTRLAGLRDRLEREVRSISPSVTVIGTDAPRLSNTSCIALAGMRSETLVIRLDLAGIAVSAGAACSSGKVGASHVLTAMGLAAEMARAAIRVSLGHATTAGDIDRFIAAMTGIVAPNRCLALGA